MKGKLKHVKRHRQGEFMPARAEDSLCERREPQVGKQTREVKEGRAPSHPVLKRAWEYGGYLGSNLRERENAEWSKGRRFLKSFTVHTCALQLQRQ